MINSTHGIISSSISSYCQEAINLFNSWQTLYGYVADAAFKNAVNNTIIAIKTIDSNLNYWNELDCVPVYVNPNQNASLVDWKVPSRIFPVSGGMTFTTLGGWKGNGTNGRISLFNPGDGGTYKFSQNSNSFGIYIKAHVNEGKTDLSGLNASSMGNELNTINNTFALNSRNNVITAQGIGNVLSARGLYSCKRTASNNWFSEKQGYDIYGVTAKETSSPSAVPNITINGFCRNTNETYSAYSTKEHLFAYFGSGLIDTFKLNCAFEKNLLLPYGLIPTKRLMLFGNSFIARGYIGKQLVADLGSYNNYEYYNCGYNGYDLTQLNSVGANVIFNKGKDYLTKDVIVLQELTNAFYNNASNVATTYSQLVTICNTIRSSLPNTKIIVSTMLPRKEVAGVLINANRQNDSDLFDDNTLNGKIRNRIVQDGHADGIADMGADPIMGIYSNGVAGVGEKNTGYFDSDEIHPNNGTGFPYIATNYIYPAVLPFL